MDEPRSHPDEELLSAAAAGQLDAANRVVLEAHLAFCRRCAGEVGELAAPGGRWLDRLAAETPPAGLWEDLAGRLDDERPPQTNDLPLPAAAAAELPPRRRPWRWRLLPLSTARYAILHGDRERDVRLMAVRLGRKRRVPRHLHLGRESLVVLEGGYVDPAGTFELGDYADYPAGSEHAPLTEPDEGCIIVSRVERGIRFTGLRGVLQRWVERSRRR